MTQKSLAHSHLYANIYIGAFYMVGDIDSARVKGEKILADLEKN